MPDPQPIQPEQPKKKTNLIPILIAIFNLLVISAFFVYHAITKKSQFVKPFLISIVVFLAVEFIVYMGYYLATKYKSKGNLPKKGKEFTIEEIEVIAEDYMWERVGIKRRQVKTFISEPRAIELGGSNILAYVWYFKDLVGIFKTEYLFACLVSDPNIRGYRQLDKKPEEEFINSYVKSIAKQPVEIRTTRLRRVDAAGSESIEEVHEPVYPSQPQKEEGKL